MSKRFGRNQKRRMRQEIEALDSLRKVGLSCIEHQRSLLEDHRNFLRHVIELVGEDSILNFEPRTVDATATDHGSKVIRRSYPQFWVNDQNIDMVRDVISHVLQTRIVQDRLKGAMHFRARLGNGDVNYTLTDRAIAMLTTRQLTARLQDEISYQLAHQLALELKR